MAFFDSRNTITAMEIGTNSIKTIMGVSTSEQKHAIQVIAWDETPSLGNVIKGEVVDVLEATELIRESFTRIESEAKRKISSVYIAISGAYIHSGTKVGSIPILSPERVITSDDITEAFRNAKSFVLSPEYNVIHTLKRGFVIDDFQRTYFPEGMSGHKLTAELHVIYGDENCIKTITTMVNNVLGFPSSRVAFSGIADIYGIEDEGKGILILDIGTGVTKYVVSCYGKCLYSGQLGVGCDHIANDISIGTNQSIDVSKSMVKSFRNKKENATETIGDMNGVIEKIMECRLTELFEIIQDDLVTLFLRDNLNMRRMLESGIILCGGGANIPIASSIAKKVFALPLTIGSPLSIPGMPNDLSLPENITPIGMMKLGFKLKQMEHQYKPSFWHVAEREVAKFFHLCSRSFRF